MKLNAKKIVWCWATYKINQLEFSFFFLPLAKSQIPTYIITYDRKC